MHTLFVGTDRTVFTPNSGTYKRFALLGSENPSDTFSLIVFSTTHHGILGDVAIAPNVHAYPTNAKSRWLYWLPALRIARALAPFAVVTAQDPFDTGIVSLVIARRAQVPLHVQVHTDFLSLGFKKHMFLNRVRVWLARFVIAHARRIQVVSQRIQESLVETFRPRVPITVLPIFTDVERIRSASAGALLERFGPFTMRFLVVARLEPEKNIALALESFAIDAPSSSCLIVLGQGSEQERLERYATELGVRNRVFFEGWVDPAPYYACASLLLATSEYEGYSMTVVEALGAGVPVLSTNVGAAKESGAIVAEQSEFPQALADWVENGPRRGELHAYPHATLSDYLAKFYADVRATASL